MKDHWTIPKVNDLGNSLGLPACLLSASWVVDRSKRKRIEQIAYAAIDHVWGRHPQLAAAPCEPSKGFPEVERGWPKSHPHDVCTW